MVHLPVRFTCLNIDVVINYLVGLIACFGMHGLSIGLSVCVPGFLLVHSSVSLEAIIDFGVGYPILSIVVNCPFSNTLCIQLHTTPSISKKLSVRSLHYLTKDIFDFTGFLSKPLILDA